MQTDTHTHEAGQVGLCKHTHPWGRSSGAMQTDTHPHGAGQVGLCKQTPPPMGQVKWGYANRHSFGTGQVGLCKQTLFWYRSSGAMQTDTPPHGAGQVGLCKQTPPMGQVKWGYANRHSLGQVSHQATILWDRSRIEPVMLRIYLKDYAMLHCS